MYTEQIVADKTQYNISKETCTTLITFRLKREWAGEK